MSVPSTARDGTVRSSSWVVTAEQWSRCAHERTALLPDGTVELTWSAPDSAAPGTGPARCGPSRPVPRAAGLAFDDRCRAFRSRPAAGRVEVLPPGSAGRPAPATTGDPGHPGLLTHPTGLAVDRRGRLYVAETGGTAVLVVDTVTGALLARVGLDGHPLDVAPDCGRAVALVRGGPGGRGGRLVLVDPRRGARPGPALTRPCYPPAADPVRLTAGAAPDGTPCVLVLWRARDGRCAVATADGTVVTEPTGATDLDLGPGGRLVVALGAGRSVLDLRLTRDSGGLRAAEDEPLLAPGADGGAVAVGPDGRVAVTTDTGYAWTAGSAARRAPEGSVVTYRLDSLAYRTRWGRVFVDACVPRGTSLALRCLTTDADEVLDPVPARPPERGGLPAPPGSTPPLPSASGLAARRRTPAQSLFRRPNGPETPWPLPGEAMPAATYEAPVLAAPGRYLWVELVLSGKAAVSPAVAALRVERPGHDLLRALPRAWSRREEDADFLQRMLAPAEGLLHELDRRAADRAALVDPRTTPSEALDWLASLAGLTLDRRWPEDARRTLVAEAYTLYRRRGTLACLARLLQIYLGHRPAIVESWRLRGRSGVVLGATPLASPVEVVGVAGSRASALGRYAAGTGAEAAHRFTVLLPGRLTDEERAVVEHVVATQRPAHTLGEICELGEGMRVGRSTRLDVTAYVGPEDDGPPPAVFGRVGIGLDAVLAGDGAHASGDEVRVGRVRVR